MPFYRGIDINIFIYAYAHGARVKHPTGVIWWIQG